MVSRKGVVGSRVGVPRGGAWVRGIRTYAIMGQERSCAGEVGDIVHGKKTTVYQDGKRLDRSIRHSTALTGITLPLVSNLSVPKALRPVVERYPSLIPILFNFWSASCQQGGSCRVRGKKLSGQENQSSEGTS